MDKLDYINDDVSVIKGILHRHSNQLQVLNDRVVALTARSMRHNITISGLTGDSPSESCKENVLDFLKNAMNITVDNATVFFYLLYCIASAEISKYGDRKKTPLMYSSTPGEFFITFLTTFKKIGPLVLGSFGI